MAEVIFRRLEQGDADRATEIVFAGDRTYVEWMPRGWEPTPYEQQLEQWRHALADPVRWNLGATTPGGRLLGVLSMHPVTGHPGMGHLSALFVDPAHHGSGIGAALLAGCEREWRRRRVTEGRLWAPRGAAAEDFYGRHGWRRSGEIRWAEPADMHIVGFVKSLAEAAD
jgi:GNAT superfamily N-acetyltransferase